MGKRVHLLTLGCPKNQIDSELVLGSGDLVVALGPAKVLGELSAS